MLEWLTSSEVKQRLNISHDSLVKIVLDGELKAYAPGEGNEPLVIPKQSWNQSEECRAAYVMNNADLGIDLWEYRNKRTGENESDIFCIIEQCAYNNLAPIDLSNYCNAPEPAPPIKRNCIDEFKILFLRDNDLFYDEYGNVNERFQSLVSIITNQTAHPAIRRLAISEILSELKFQKDDIEAYDKETTPAPQRNPLADAEAEEFIRSLQISYLDNTEVKIQYRGKSKNWNCDALGFRDSNTKEWKDFLRILKDRDHVYILGPAYSINKGTQQKERNTEYDKNKKLLKEIDKKLIIFLNKNYPVIFPENFHLYERQLDKGDGIYSFKFKTPSTKPSYKSKEQALKRLEMLVRNGASMDAISDAVVIAMDAGASKDEVSKIVKDIDIVTSQNEDRTDDLEKDEVDELY